MYFKSEYHEELFNEYVAKLNNSDNYYLPFAYVASAIEKKQVITALSDHNVSSKKLLKMSEGWSSSEKKMLEFAYQCFTGRNLFEHDEEGMLIPTFPTIAGIFSSLDSENARIVIEALTYKYL